MLCDKCSKNRALLKVTMRPAPFLAEISQDLCSPCYSDLIGTIGEEVETRAEPLTGKKK